MKYQFQLLLISVLLLCGVAAADSVVKTLYVDGAYVGEMTVPAALSYVYDHIIIGAEGGGYRYNEYNGKIDEFAIYKGVLSSTRIAAHYNALASGYVTEVTSDRPLLYLRFEDPSSANGDPAENSGSVDIDGTYIDNVTLSAGAVGNAAVFSNDGEEPDAPGDCVDVLDQTKAFSFEDVTIELWMNSTADPNNYPRLFQHNGAYNSTNSYGVQLPDANSIAVIGGGATNYFDAPGTVWVTDGNWHHIVVTYDSTVDVITHKPYVEEVMDDNPVLYLRFEEATPVDSSGNNYWVAYTGVQISPFETSFGIGSSASLLNTSVVAAGPATTMPTDLLLTGDNYAFVNGDISFEFWANSTALDTYAVIFQQGGNENIAPGISNSNGTLRILNGDDGDPNNTQNWSYTGAAAPLDGKWHHFVLTYDEIDPNHMNIELYKDGVKAASPSIISTTGQAKLGPEMNHLVIGAMGRYDAPSGYNRYSGLIDEFAIYPGILSATRVAVHYAAGLDALKGQTCAQVWLKGDGLAVDIDKDCDVDLTDFMVIASDWLLCNDPALFESNPACTANW